jgi:HK97 family phage prohead protease
MLPYEVKDLGLSDVKARKAEGTGLITELEGYVAAFGNVDAQNDVIEPGAFDRTIAERVKGGKVKLLIDHLWDVEHTAGTIDDAQPDAHGLKVHAVVDEDDDVQRAVRKVDRGHVTGMSIGYETMRAEYEEREDAIIRHLTELKLFEGSITPFPANEAAVILGVKSQADRIVKQVQMQLDAALKYGRRNSSSDEERLRAIMREVEELLASGDESNVDKRTAPGESDGSPAPLVAAPQRLIIAKARLALQRSVELSRS